MTDELSIQQRPSAVPYLLTGAGVGVGGGLAVNHWTKFTKGTPMSQTDIVNEINKDDAFVKRTAEGAEHAQTWKDVKAKKEAYEAAEKAVEDAKKKTLPQNSEAFIKWDKAKKAYEGEIERLTEQETKRLENASKGIKNVTEVKPWGNLSEAPTIVGKNLAEVKVIYENLESNYNRALATAKTDPEYKALERIYNAETKVVSDAYADAYNKISTLTKKKDITNAWNNLKGKPATKLKRATGLYADAEKTITMNADFLKGIEGAEVDLTKKPTGKNIVYKSYTVNVRQPDGSIKKVTRYVAVDKKVANNALAEARKVFVEEVYAGMQKHVALQTELTNLADTIGKKHQAAFNKYSSGVVVDVKALNPSELKSDITALKKLHGVDPARLNATEKALIKKYNPAGKAGKAIGYAEAQLKAATEFAAETTRLNSEIAEIVSSNSRVAQAQGEINNFITRNKGVKNALGELRKQFPNLFPRTSATTAMTEEEIATQAKAWAEKNIEKSFGENVTKYENLYKKACEESGEVNKEALKAAEENASKLKGEFEQATKSLGEKYLKNGKAKWIAPLVGGVALALGALAFRPSGDKA